MRHHHDGRALLFVYALEQAEYAVGGLGVEVAGRLVRYYDFGEIQYGAGDCYALLAGGDWASASIGVGSRCRSANAVRSFVAATIGGRGSSRVSRYIDKI